MIHSSGGARWTWASPGMTKTSPLVAPSSHRSSTAPICFSAQCRDGESLLHGFFRSERSCNLFLHALKQRRVFLDLAKCYGYVVRSRFVAAASSANRERGVACVSWQSRYGESPWQDLVIASGLPCACAASCMSEPLTTSRAIVLDSGWIRPPVSAHAIRSSAPSSHRSSTAPVCLSAQCRDGESLLHGFFRSERSCNLFLHALKQRRVFLDLAKCYGYVVRSRFVAAASSANRERGAGCVRSRFVRAGPSAKTVRDASCKSGPLTAGRAASARVDLLHSLRRVQAARRDAVIRSSGGARWTSPGMTEPSLLVGMLQPPSPAPSPAPSPPAGHSMRRLQGGSRMAFRPHLEAAGDVKNTSSWEASVSKPSRFLTCPFLAQSAIAAVVRPCPVRAVCPLDVSLLGTVSHRSRSQALPGSGRLSCYRILLDRFWSGPSAAEKGKPALVDLTPCPKKP